MTEKCSCGGSLRYVSKQDKLYSYQCVWCGRGWTSNEQLSNADLGTAFSSFE